VKHIIVEGPDGAGKSTLIAHLQEQMGLPIHDKASTSVGGPVDSLAKWVDDDMPIMAVLRGGPAYIYDRHPIISEPIYGTIVRSKPQPPFSNEQYLRNVGELLYNGAVVVWCLPDLNTVATNVFANARGQMPGVTLKIGKLHQAYMTAMFRWRGPKRQYDYTRHDKAWFTDELKKMVQE
jgi:hypothetical protein